MSVRLRFLLDSNIIIPLEDSMIALQGALMEFVRLANQHGHTLLYHPATEADIRRDGNIVRRNRTLERLGLYQRLEDGPPNPWGLDPVASPNDWCDDEILYAIDRSAAHALITEDHRLHSKAHARGLAHKVYYVQAAMEWLRRLHALTPVVLPNIDDIALHTLVPRLTDTFYDSLRSGYALFDDWFRRVAATGRRAWVYRPDLAQPPSAICIYAAQDDERINDAGEQLPGRALKLCTFKVGPSVRGRKIGELFLRAAFQYATANACENIFIHVRQVGQQPLIRLLEEFGFRQRGEYQGDLVFVKAHPRLAPAIDLPAFEYCRLYYPHYRIDFDVRKFVVPIVPRYHQVLFPDFEMPGNQPLHRPASHVGNAMKLAYLCHTPSNQVRAGDLLIFYRSHDLKMVTTLAIVEESHTLTSATEIAALVSRRTVYSTAEIEEMAARRTKVYLFRLIQHLERPVSLARLRSEHVISGTIQSILQVNEQSFSRILNASRR